MASRVARTSKLVALAARAANLGWRQAAGHRILIATCASRVGSVSDRLSRGDMTRFPSAPDPANSDLADSASVEVKVCEPLSGWCFPDSFGTYAHHYLWERV